MTDKIKLGLAILLVMAGLGAYYYLAEQAMIIRVLCVIAGLGLGAAVAWYSTQGREFYAFSREAWSEARKVVWPTRKETWQTTLVVFTLVVVMGTFLWLVDWGLLVVVQRIMGRTE